MKWTLIAFVVLGIGTAHAEDDYEFLTLDYDNLIKKGYEVAAITPDGRGGQVYHMTKPGASFYVCHAEVLAPGLPPRMDLCEKVMR